MTQSSYFYDGAAHGDAKHAPYHAELYCKLRSLARASGQAFVLDDFPTSRWLTAAISGGTNISTGNGVAMIDGALVSASGLITIPLNTTDNPRIDLLVARVDWNENYSRTLLKAGYPAPIPTPPVPVQISGDVFEMPIAYVIVDSGAVAFTNSDVIDQRRYMESAQNLHAYGSENICQNSEFMAGSDTAANAYNTPAYWAGLNIACETYPKFDQMDRGNTILVTSTSTIRTLQLSQRVLHTNSPSATPITVRFLIEVIQGEVQITTPYSTKNIIANTQVMDVFIRETYSAPQYDVSLTFNSAGAYPTIFRLGQVTISYGNGGVAYRPKRELILFSKKLDQPDYEWPTTLASGTYTLPLPDNIGYGVNSVISQLRFRDSASAGSSNILAQLQHSITGDVIHLMTPVGRDANDSEHVQQGFVATPYNTGDYISNPPAVAPTEQDIDLLVTPTGATAGDVGVSYLGCST